LGALPVIIHRKEHRRWHLEGNVAAQILAAVFAPLLRTGPTDPKLPPQRAARPQLRARKAPRRKKPNHRALRSAEARERARAALKANPGATLTAVAEAAGVSRSTVVNARDELAAEARRKPRATAKPAKQPTERRARAQQFLKDALAHGPRRVSEVEEAAAKAHVDLQTLEQARGDLGVVTSRANTGSTLSVQWSLPG
jgi:hypothetical protein